MTKDEFDGALDRLERVKGGHGAMLRATEKATEARSFWRDSKAIGRVTEAGIGAAQIAAMELAVIAEGVLHILGRVPADCVGHRPFGVLGPREVA